jgi:NADPH-dependent curcumin reductase CurA
MSGPHRRWVLRARPAGAVSEADFALVAGPIPAPGAGQLLVENTHLSIEPAIRQWIGGRGRYLPPIGPGDTVRSVTLGRVVGGALPGFQTGDWVRVLGGWETHSVVGARDFPQRVEAAHGLPMTAHLGVLGGAGFAAYFGLRDVARAAAGEAVLVSAAAGAVGSIAAQYARVLGCAVTGIAGGEAKCRWLREVAGVGAIDRHGADLRGAIGAACPRGVDVFFDTTGGPVLEAALARLARGGRVVICGATAQYDAAEGPRGPANYLCLLEQGARMEGFVASHYAGRFAEAVEVLGNLAASGQVQFQETVAPGLDAAPGALRAVLDGAVAGRMLVAI